MIKYGSIGFIDANDTNSHSYYLVEFKSSAYTFYENVTIDGQVIDCDELV